MPNTLLLKPHQLINFPENEERIATINQLSLSTTAVQSLDPDIEFADKIKAALTTDPNIGPYLTNLQDPTLPCDEEVQLYLEPYSMSDDLVLRHGLIYIPMTMSSNCKCFAPATIPLFRVI